MFRAFLFGDSEFVSGVGQFEGSRCEEESLRFLVC